jgi:hypothetical protein
MSLSACCAGLHSTPLGQRVTRTTLSSSHRISRSNDVMLAAPNIRTALPCLKCLALPGRLGNVSEESKACIPPVVQCPAWPAKYCINRTSNAERQSHRGSCFGWKCRALCMAPGDLRSGGGFEVCSHPARNGFSTHRSRSRHQSTVHWMPLMLCCGCHPVRAGGSCGQHSS